MLDIWCNSGHWNRLELIPTLHLHNLMLATKCNTSSRIGLWTGLDTCGSIAVYETVSKETNLHKLSDGWEDPCHLELVVQAWTQWELKIGAWFVWRGAVSVIHTWVAMCTTHVVNSIYGDTLICFQISAFHLINRTVITYTKVTQFCFNQKSSFSISPKIHGTNLGFKTHKMP